VGSNRACKGNNGEGAEFIVGSKNHQSRPLLWQGHVALADLRAAPSTDGRLSRQMRRTNR